MENYYLNHKGVNIKALDIGLVGTKKGIVPWLIKKATGCKYNHAVIVAECLDELWVYEAREKGFYPTKPLHRWVYENEEKGNLMCFMSPKKLVLSKKIGFQRISNLIGKNYEFLNLTLFQLFRILFSKFPGPKNNNQVICSEAVAKVYEEIFPDNYQTTPKEIFESNELVIKLEC